MTSKPRLVAAITASGAILCLSVSAQGHNASNQGPQLIEPEKKSLSARVEQLREKLLTSSPVFGRDSAEERIDNIVQFFNCMRPGWKNC
jgi:hypothetical protein